MGKNRKRKAPAPAQGNDNRPSGKKTLPLVLIVLAGGFAAVIAYSEGWLGGSGSEKTQIDPEPTVVSRSTGVVGGEATSQTGATPGASSEMRAMDVATAVMVTVQLDFDDKPPSIAEALTQIERRHTPDDGTGRTFAILDAYGEPTPDGKLHLSMHVSSEKPGTGALVYRKTGEILWQSKINPTLTQPASPYAGKKLTVMIEDETGSPRLVDGSRSPGSILEAMVPDRGVALKDLWPEGQQREATFIYSACGCPVKVKVERVGNRTRRTEELPVIFPDDPAAVALINRLMGW